MSMELTQEQIQQILQGIAIPPQPQIMVDLQMEQLRPDSSIEAISRLISQDVGLSGAILKTVNSAFFGLSNKISSVSQAVSLLGINSVINLVNAQSIKGELTDEKIVALSKFWDLSTDVAMASATIAKQIGYPSPDEAYSLGLFHNSGIPLLMDRFPDYLHVLEQAYAAPQERIIDTENDALHTNHAVVGYYVGRSWNLPEYICHAIADHHSLGKVFNEPEDRADPRKKTLLAILKMAEHICGVYRIIGGQDTDHEWAQLEEMILLYVGLGQYDFQNLKEHIQELGISFSTLY